MSKLAAESVGHTLNLATAFKTFVDDLLRRRVFVGEALTPVLGRLAQGREIAGLSAYAQ